MESSSTPKNSNSSKAIKSYKPNQVFFFVARKCLSKSGQRSFELVGPKTGRREIVPTANLEDILLGDFLYATCADKGRGFKAFERTEHSGQLTVEPGEEIAQVFLTAKLVCSDGFTFFRSEDFADALCAESIKVKGSKNTFNIKLKLLPKKMHDKFDFEATPQSDDDIVRIKTNNINLGKKGEQAETPTVKPARSVSLKETELKTETETKQKNTPTQRKKYQQAVVLEVEQKENKFIHNVYVLTNSLKATYVSEEKLEVLTCFKGIFEVDLDKVCVCKEFKEKISRIIKDCGDDEGKVWFAVELEYTGKKKKENSAKSKYFQEIIVPKKFNASDKWNHKMAKIQFELHQVYGYRWTVVELIEES